MTLEMKWPELSNYIAGSFTPVQPRGKALLSPNDGSWLGEQVGSSHADMDRALAAAAACHQTAQWAALGGDRAVYLLRIAERLSEHTTELAALEAANTGIVLAQTQRLMQLLPLIFKGAAMMARDHSACQHLGAGVELWHKPWGPALCIAPWNSPLPIGAHKLASALAAGAPAILKPSEFTPFTTQRLFEIIDACDLPSGVVQLVHGSGDEGAYLAADARIKAVSFTGGLAGGRAVAQICARDCKRLQLELGGHNPLVVLPDADRELALDGLMSGLTTLNGQWCRAVGRVFVPESWRDGWGEGFLRRRESLAIGSSLDPHSAMGPLIHKQHKQHLLTSVQQLVEHGGRCIGGTVAGGKDDAFLRPDLVEGVSLQDDQTELFGPLAVLHTYRDLGELSSAVARSPYGLAAYVYGGDSAATMAFARSLEVGSTKINGVTLTSLSPSAPRSAWGLSGHGEEGTFETYRFFQGSTVVGAVHH